MGKQTNNYPTILIHGLLGWGENVLFDKLMPYWGFAPWKNIIPYLRENGYEVYYPNVGFFNCAWDRACEMWAFLMGGTVDYGKVHSEKSGHARYGRTYEKGAIEDWGTPGDHEKINIVGHSFGGPTVKMFAEIITHGAEEEIAGTDPDDLSDFFKKDKAQKLHSVTTLSGVNNGTLLASFLGKKGMQIFGAFFFDLCYLLGDTPIVKIYDACLNQWGATVPTNEQKGIHIRNPLKMRDVKRKYVSNFTDFIGTEMQFDTVQEDVNPYQVTDPKVYYFARTACMSHDRGDTKHLPDHGMYVGAMIFGFITGLWDNQFLKDKYGLDATWYPNDGLVNVVGQRAPWNAPQTEWNPLNQKVKPGIWYNMPVEYKHHMSWMGCGMKKGEFFRYTKEMFDSFRELPVTK